MTRRQRLALVLTVLGLVGILWGVLHVLEAANGPGAGPRRFPERRSYNQVKVSVHEAIPGGLLRALAGVSLVLLGARLRRPALETP